MPNSLISGYVDEIRRAQFGGDVREALEQAVEDINRELRMKQEENGVISDE